MVKIKKTFILLKKRKIYQRLDIYPFFVIYSLLIMIFIIKKMNLLFFNCFFVGIIFIFQISVYFLKFWFNDIFLKIYYHKVDNIENATDVKVVFFADHFNIKNRSIICKIERKNNIIKTEIEKIIYLYDENKNEFFPSKFEILKNNKVSQLLKSKPLTKDMLAEKRARFGDNLIKIPIPSFISLYIEHIITPFFIFQLFCTLLRSFDNYSYNSLISLIMILIFEIAIACQRIFNLATLRNMRSPPHYVYVYRDNEWNEVPSSQLFPGDIVSVIEGSSLRNIKEEDKDSKSNFFFRIIKSIKEIKKREDEAKNQKSINTVLNKYKEKDILPASCDILLLSGSAIVDESLLTGESIPQIKESAKKMEHLKNLILDSKNKHKNSIIFSGTKVVKIEKNDEYEKLPKNIKTPPPDKGIIGLIIKTGFSTLQGKILHKVLYNKEKIKIINQKEDIIIIAILLIISILASFYVLIEGIKREEILTYKLILRCIIIITSIVPADLPIELSLINNKSLSFFESKRIVCIEPNRIPLAGKIDICCFDKTGTLTKDEFNIKGIIDIDSHEPEYILDVKEETFSVILGCNTIIDIDGRLVGDPIDIALFKEIGGKIDNEEITCKRKTKIIQIKKYIFESNLKKMTVLAKVYSEKHKKNPYIRVLCKGAPETIKTLLKEVPQNYDECYSKWVKKGYRVLALAYNDNEKFDYNTKRKELEKDLIFCGFLIAETPLKQNVDKYIKELIKAKYNICIITGDHLLSTLKVFKDLKLGPEKFASLKIENKKIKWIDLDNNIIKETKSFEEVKLLSNEYTLGLTGDEYKSLNLTNIPEIYQIIQYIKLFCRISQTQKSEIVKDLIKCGKNPSMCGDGSNDMSALKIATIGVVILNIKESKIQKKEPLNFLSFDEETTIKNWIVTSVAPFTSKGESIKCIKNIFVQGRCAIVTNIQMYKIFILNSLLTIYIESFIALKGIKFSEYQTVYLGFAVSMFFLMLSKAKPLNKVNPNKPPITIFTWSSFFSIFFQVIVHISAMILVINITENVDIFSIGQEKSLDEKFTPNLLNTIVFLFQIFNQTIIFVINYQGEPFMENILKNSSMMLLITVIVSIGCIIIFDLYPQLNEDFELVSLPEDNNYKMKLIIIMISNFSLCYIIEKWRNLFGFYEPYEIKQTKKKKIFKN